MNPSDAPMQKRSFQDIHRDFWRLIFANPLVFIVIPTLAFIPADLIAEYLSSGQGTLEALRTSQRVNHVATAVVGTYLAAVTLATLKAMSEGRRPGLAESLRLGSKEWGVVSMTSLSVGIRIGLGFLLFIIPGIILSCRYVFAIPVTVFENLPAKGAVLKSTEIAKGQQFRIFQMFTYPVLIYLPIIFAFAFGVSYAMPENDLLLVNAVLTGIPFNMAIACTTFGLGFTYLELRRPDLLKIALQKAGAASPAVPTGVTPENTVALPWPLLIGFASWSGIIALLYFVVGLGSFPLLAGNLLSEKSPEKAVGLYEMALALEPGNPEIRLSVGAQLLNLPGMLDRSIVELEKAVAMAPEHGEAHLFLCVAQLTAGNMEVARSELGLAEKFGVESKDVLATVQENFAMGGSGAGDSQPSGEDEPVSPD